MPLFEIEDLSVTFKTPKGLIRAVEGLSLSVEEGETLAIVGESGCGKSATSLAILNLLPPAASMQVSKMRFDGKDLSKFEERDWRKFRGKEIAMVFQDPTSSLNPCYTVESQLAETLKAHVGGNRSEIHARVIQLLEKVGIPAPEERARSYPHELSGGMCQRVMIAMAIACKPKLLIADEPTTALDVTIQAQILDLLARIQEEERMAMILITHDLGVVAERANRILVMYAGQAVELGEAKSVLHSPKHPYTAALLKCRPGTHRKLGEGFRLPTIGGSVPDPLRRPEGCRFHPRCEIAQDRCRTDEPALEKSVRCFFPLSPRSES